jgi:hypothetical protein
VGFYVAGIYFFFVAILPFVIVRLRRGSATDFSSSILSTGFAAVAVATPIIALLSFSAAQTVESEYLNIDNGIQVSSAILTAVSASVSNLVACRLGKRKEAMLPLSYILYGTLPFISVAAVMSSVVLDSI